MRCRTCLAAVTAVLCLFAAMPARAADDALKAKARELFKANQEAVVTVKMVISMYYVFGGQQQNKQEYKSEVSGTVVDPSGLTVLSLYASNPNAAMGELAMSMNGENMEFKIESSVTDSKIVLADGTEIPAVQVLKDKDLDLVFVRPKEKQDKAWPFVKFEKAADPAELDEIVVIGRLGRAVNRASSLALGSVQALVQKPRTFYVCDLATGFASMGCPVFSAKGETLGLAVVRSNPVKGGAMGLFGAMQPVVLPAEDLLETTRQALSAKPEGEGEAKAE
ncbi:MAG: trypsin-like peptidase domain-containing protein [Planctomycetota bacterium]|nr:trypsin-like peptidase domain-containing protein [Planctomycetota bacterium]